MLQGEIRKVAASEGPGEKPRCNGRTLLSRIPINKTQQYRLGDDIRIGCQRIPASVLDYIREWVKE